MARSLLRIVAFVTIIAAQSLPAFAQAPSRTGSRPAAATTAIVNLNTASAADFEALPGIGAKMAARIVDYRQKNGPFKKIEDLMNVPGIGEKNFLKLKPQLTVASTKADASVRQN
jgi:competence protein ComEA